MHLLEHFKELTVHPKNAEELKGLILQLAVQGKLTQKWRSLRQAQGPPLEPASLLLEKIRAEKEQLIKAGKIKKEKPLPAIEENEISFKLPKSWAWSRLNDVCEYIQRGKSPKYTDIPKIPVISQKCVQWTGFDISKVKFISEESFEKYSEERILQVGDLLWNSTGDGTLGRVITYPGSDFDKVVADSHVTVVRGLKNSIIPDYLWVYSASPFIQSLVSGRVSGSTKQTELSTGTIKLMEFSLPPLEEQKAIVEVVNQLFAEVEQLEDLTKERIKLKADFVTSALNQLSQAADQDVASRWAFIQEQFGTFFTEKSTIKKLRESILQLAVQGKLTHHWRTDGRLSGVEVEPASDLLEKIKAEKAELIKAGEIKKDPSTSLRVKKPLPEISEEEIPYELPEGWVWCRMGEFVRFMAYGTSQKTNDNYYDVPVLRMGNITSEGELVFRNLKYIPAKHPDLPKLYLKPGDLVFNRTNSFELVGKSGVFKGEDKTYTLASYLIKVSLFNEYCDSDYINTYIISSVCRKTQIEPQITAQTNQANFSGSKLKEILVPLAPFEEQKAIVKKVNELMALCDQLELEIENQQTTQEQWMQGCLREVVKAKAPDELPLNMAAEPIPRYGNK